jgi:hypothetical protein
MILQSPPTRIPFPQRGRGSALDTPPCPAHAGRLPPPSAGEGWEGGAARHKITNRRAA